MTSMKVPVARAIANNLGYDYDRVFEHKAEWVAEGGMRGGRFHDVNEPYRADFDAAADAVLEAMMEPTPGMKSEAADYLNSLGISEGSYDFGHDLIVKVIQAARDGK